MYVCGCVMLCCVGVFALFAAWWVALGLACGRMDGWMDGWMGYFSALDKLDEGMDVIILPSSFFAFFCFSSSNGHDVNFARRSPHGVENLLAMVGAACVAAAPIFNRLDRSTVTCMYDVT